MEQTYRFNFQLRRKGQATLDQNHLELKSEDYDSIEEFCQALASEALEMLKEDIEYLEGVEDDNN